MILRYTEKARDDLEIAFRWYEALIIDKIQKKTVY